MLLIQNGTIVSPRGSQIGDILVDKEKIVKIFTEAQKEERDAYLNDIKDELLIEDATGKLVFPGFIDAHTHFELHVAGTVTCDDFASGTKAAISGGTTSIIDFGTQYPGETLREGMENWHKKASVGCSCDYGFHMSISEWNEETSKQCQDMMDEGLSTFKIYTTYDIMLEDREMFEVLQRLKEVGGITGVHCENHGMIQSLREQFSDANHINQVRSHYRTRPALAEAEAINRLLYFSEKVDWPMIDVHLTCKEGLEEIRAARKRGVKVFAETCPQYLTMTSDLYELPGFEGAKYVIAPPLRTQADIDALWEALANGDIQTIATDHCSFTTAQKELGKDDFRKIPGGMPGVEHRVELIFSEGVQEGRITKEQFCALLSENAAKIYGLFPKKGILAEGSDADIVILDPSKEKTLSISNQVSKSDYCPHEGKVVRGVVEKVYLRGELVASNGQVLKENLGRFLKREKFQEV